MALKLLKIIILWLFLSSLNKTTLITLCWIFFYQERLQRYFFLKKKKKLWKSHTKTLLFTGLFYFPADDRYYKPRDHYHLPVHHWLFRCQCVHWSRIHCKLLHVHLMRFSMVLDEHKRYSRTTKTCRRTKRHSRSAALQLTWDTCSSDRTALAECAQRQCQIESKEEFFVFFFKL